MIKISTDLNESTSVTVNIDDHNDNNTDDRQ